jgi:ribosomal protein S6
MSKGFDIKDLVDEARFDRAADSVITSAEAKYGSIIEQHEKEEKDPEFFGERNPSYVLQKESPQHRVICYLSAEGKTISEIAEQTGFSKPMIGYVQKQPWACDLISKLIQRHGGDQVIATLKATAQPSINLIKDIIEGRVEADMRLRATMAQQNLDRIYGKAQQTVMHGKVDASELTDQDLAKYLPDAEVKLN